MKPAQKMIKMMTMADGGAAEQMRCRMFANAIEWSDFGYSICANLFAFVLRSLKSPFTQKYEFSVHSMCRNGNAKRFRQSN